MAHSFVFAKFSPTLTATNSFWLSSTTVQAASSIVCRPFLALTVAVHESHPRQQYCRDYVALFPISSQKPSDEFAEYYATLSLQPSTGTNFLHLSPSSGSQAVLYIYTVPALHLDIDLPSNALPHQLDPESLEQFRTLAEDHSESWHSARVKHLNSGGEESVQEEWETWHDDKYLDPMPCGDLAFEFLNPESADLRIVTSPRVIEELMIFKKLVYDYNKGRVGATIKWCLESRELRSLLVSDVGSNRTRPSHLDNEKMKQANLRMLQQMKSPVDRQLRITEEWNLKRENVKFPIGHLASLDPPILFSNIRIILFDSIGSLFDRETSVWRALRSVGPQEIDKCEPEDVLAVYFEAESLLLQDNPEWDFPRIVEGAQKASLHRLSTPNEHDPVLLRQACEEILRLGFYPDAEKTVEELCSQGITVVGLGVPDASFVLPPLPESFIFDSFSQDRRALLRTSPDLFSTLFERLRSIRDDLEGKDQVLVISTGQFRVLEPARIAGYPTALLQQNLESEVNLFPPCLTTLRVPGGLEGLKDELKTFGGDCTASYAGTEVFTVRVGPYQGYAELGIGRFGQVRGGVHVLTGASVAIKYDSPELPVRRHVCEANEYPCTLRYEAQIYRILDGEPGIPSLRWFSVEEGMHALVLDELGPNLNAIRHLCRGRLSFKTVLMLGLQMLERVAVVHSRGLILRDVTPDHFVMGLGNRSSIVHLLGFGFAKPYMDPMTNEHIPFAENLERVGTTRYASFNMLVKREMSRRDDIEALGNVLLYLLRGRLPWQGIYAPSAEARYVRSAHMRVGKAMHNFIAESPGRDFWHVWFKHCRELGFTDTPDYAFLKDSIIRQIGGAVDGKYDWLDGAQLEFGTLVPGEYKLAAELFHDNFWMWHLD